MTGSFEYFCNNLHAAVLTAEGGYLRRFLAEDRALLLEAKAFFQQQPISRLVDYTFRTPSYVGKMLEQDGAPFRICPDEYQFTRADLRIRRIGLEDLMHA